MGLCSRLHFQRSCRLGTTSELEQLRSEFVEIIINDNNVKKNRRLSGDKAQWMSNINFTHAPTTTLIAYTTVMRSPAEECPLHSSHWSLYVRILLGLRRWLPARRKMTSCPLGATTISHRLATWVLSVWRVGGGVWRGRLVLTLGESGWERGQWCHVPCSVYSPVMALSCIDTAVVHRIHKA